MAFNLRRFRWGVSCSHFPWSFAPSFYLRNPRDRRRLRATTCLPGLAMSPCQIRVFRRHRRFGELGKFLAGGIHPNVTIAVRARTRLVEQHALCRNRNNRQRGDLVGRNLIHDRYGIAGNLSAGSVKLPG